MGKRLSPAQRRALGDGLKVLYDRGVSIRALAEQSKRSYSATRALLLLVGTKLRRPGGPHGRRDASTTSTTTSLASSPVRNSA